MPSQPVKYFTERMVFDEVISFEDFPKHCVAGPRDQGYKHGVWPLEFRGYAVAPQQPDINQYRICLNGFSVAFGPEHVVLVAEKRKVLIRKKDIIDKFKMTDQKVEETLSTEDIPFRREDVFQAAAESGFKRTKSCCDPTLEKMCSMDEYKGDLEAFVKRYLRIAGYRK